MLKRNHTVKLIAFLALFAIRMHASTSAEDLDHVVGEVGEAVRDYVDLLHDRIGFSGVVLAARDGKVVAEISRGLVDKQGTTPIESTTLFEIASCTKSFTAVAVLQLVESGKLSLDDSIAGHLPGVPDNCKTITIRHLLSHTSGIPGTNTKGSGSDITKVVPTFLAGGPKHTPGTHYEYWNQGYALLSEIVAQASGSSFTQYIRDNIFARCQMQASRFTGDESPADLTVAVGESTRGAARPALEHPYGDDGFQYRGMGGLVTNVQDLWKWDRALQANELIGEQSMAEMIAPGSGGYGLGFRTATDPSGSPCHLHSGSVRGFLAEVRRYPSVDGAIFVLSNTDDSLPFELMKVGVEQIVFGNTPNTAIPGKPSIEQVASIIGEYKDAKGRKLIVEDQAGYPSLKIYWGGPVTYGRVGLSDSAVPCLYMVKPNAGTIDFVKDTELEFFPNTAKAITVSLLGLQPKLTFTRTSQ